MSSQIATPGIFEVFVVYEAADGRTLGASVARMRQDMIADLVVFVGGPDTAPSITVYGVAYSERKEGEKPIPGTWHY